MIGAEDFDPHRGGLDIRADGGVDNAAQAVSLPHNAAASASLAG
jgi:hypothetical protein